MKASAAMLPPAISYRRTSVRLLNYLLNHLQRLGIGRIDLSAQRLLDDACKATGLWDFGSDPFLEPFHVLLDALNNEANLHPAGRYLNRLSLLRILKHRLWAENLFQRHPEILQRPLKSPVVIVGLARSGTTRLHRLLATDRRFCHLRAWEAINPVPWPGSFTARRDPRLSNVETVAKMILYISPQIAHIHPIAVHEAEEEAGLLQHAFSSKVFEVQARVPSFARWLVDNDQRYAYDYMAKLLKLCNWFRHDAVDHPWILKTPQHMQDLDALIDVFPDAKLIFIHRDPVKAVGSACSLVWNTIVRDSDSVDPLAIGRDWSANTLLMISKTLRVRHEKIAADRQLDILYDDMNRNWRATMQRIYQFIGWPFCEQAERGMQRWLDNNRQHKHGAHHYSLRDFGLQQSLLERELAFYRRRFSIPVEPIS